MEQLQAFLRKATALCRAPSAHALVQLSADYSTCVDLLAGTLEEIQKSYTEAVRACAAADSLRPGAPGIPRITRTSQGGHSLTVDISSSAPLQKHTIDRAFNDDRVVPSIQPPVVVPTTAPATATAVVRAPARNNVYVVIVNANNRIRIGTVHDAAQIDPATVFMRLSKNPLPSDDTRWAVPPFQPHEMTSLDRAIDCAIEEPKRQIADVSAELKRLLDGTRLAAVVGAEPDKATCHRRVEDLVRRLLDIVDRAGEGTRPLLLLRDAFRLAVEHTKTELLHCQVSQLAVSMATISSTAPSIHLPASPTRTPPNVPTNAGQTFPTSIEVPAESSPNTDRAPANIDQPVPVQLDMSDPRQPATDSSGPITGHLARLDDVCGNLGDSFDPFSQTLTVSQDARDAGVQRPPTPPLPPPPPPPTPSSTPEKFAAGNLDRGPLGLLAEVAAEVSVRVPVAVVAAATEDKTSVSLFGLGGVDTESDLGAVGDVKCVDVFYSRQHTHARDEKEALANLSAQTENFVRHLCEQATTFRSLTADHAKEFVRHPPVFMFNLVSCTYLDLTSGKLRLPKAEELPIFSDRMSGAIVFEQDLRHIGGAYGLCCERVDTDDEPHPILTPSALDNILAPLFNKLSQPSKRMRVDSD